MPAKVKIGDAVKKIMNLLQLDKDDIYSIYLFSILAGLVSLSLPLGIQSIIGFVLAGAMSSSIIVLVVLVLIGTIVNGVLQVRQLELIEKVEQKLFVRYSFEIGDRIPKLDIEELDNYYLPELTNRFFDLPILQKSLQKLLIEIPPAIFQIILGTLLLSFYHPLFIAFGIILLFSVLLILRFTSTAGFQTSMLASDNKYRLAAWFQEIARGVKIFKYGRKTNINLVNTDHITSEYLDAKIEHFKILKVQYWSLIAFKVLVTAGMLVFGVSLLLSNQINIGQFIASDIVILAIIGSVEKLIGSMDLVYEVLTSVEKLNKLANATTEVNGTAHLQDTKVGLRIEYQNVGYTYQDGKSSLEKINLKIESGDWINIYGGSGSGKSTLIRLMTGAFKNFTGVVLLDGLPVKNYDLNSLRSYMGVLLSDQELFNGTLLSNITLDNHLCSIERVKQVSMILGLNAYIESTDFGLDTPVNPTGKKLNSLVKKQILLARVFAQKARVYILEEPFAGLTPKQHTALVDFLQSENCTVIITSTKKLDVCHKFLNLENN